MAMKVPLSRNVCLAHLGRLVVIVSKAHSSEITPDDVVCERSPGRKRLQSNVLDQKAENFLPEQKDRHDPNLAPDVNDQVWGRSRIT